MHKSLWWNLADAGFTQVSDNFFSEPASLLNTALSQYVPQDLPACTEERTLSLSPFALKLAGSSMAVSAISWKMVLDIPGGAYPV